MGIGDSVEISKIVVWLLYFIFWSWIIFIWLEIRKELDVGKKIIKIIKGGKKLKINFVFIF